MTNASALNTPLVEALCLTKSYGTTRAVDNLSLTINRGDILGLVGANGSGKTTLIRMIVGLISPSGGSCILHKSEAGSPLRLGAIVEQPSLYMNMSGQKNIEIACDMANISSQGMAKKFMQLVGLNPKTRTVVKKYSLGMKQRLSIAMALINEPDLLLLDEPTNGLDPQGIVEIRELLTKLNKETGITILISSHILTELGRLATRFAFIDKGKLVKECTLHEIEKECNPPLNVTFSDNETAAKSLEGKLDFVKGDKYLSFDPKTTLSQIVKLTEGTGVEVLSGAFAPLDLEAYFFNLIKEDKINE